MMIKVPDDVRLKLIEKYPCEEISIEITEECHQNCIHCSSEAGDKWADELAFHEIEQIIRLGKEFLGTKVISLSGGDPILREGFVELCSLIVDELGLDLLVYSSGIIRRDGVIVPFTSTEAFNIIKDKFANKPGCKLIYSIEGGNRYSHEFITRTPHSWQSTWESIQDSIDSNIYTEVHTCPMTTNMYELADLYARLCDYGVNRWSLLRLVPQGRASRVKYLLTNKKEFRELIDIIENVLFKEKEMIAEGTFATEVRVGDPLNFYGCLSQDPIIPMTTCNAAKNRILIRANGETQFCAALKHSPNYDYGNVRKTNIVDLWCISDMAVALRKFHEGGWKNISGKCNTCESLQVCKGGCLSQRIATYGDMMVGPDPLCPKEIDK